MSIINSQPLIGASGNQSTAYNLTRSLRFRSSASTYLNRSQVSGNRQKWTMSFWVKRGLLGSGTYMFYSTGGSASGNTYAQFYFYNDQINYIDGTAGTGNNIYLTTTQVFRDPSAWYHIVISADTTQATASNRVKMYVNGSQITSFTNSTYPSQNYNTRISDTTAPNASEISAGGGFDGYLAEWHNIDGQQLTPSDFGETDTATGVWKPKKYTGTYGTNGFYLKFDNLTSTSTLGNDSSGNSNTWTVNNISLTSGSTYDSMKDVPTLTDADTANYCTLNPVAPGDYFASGQSALALTNGNLNYGSTGRNAFGTMAVSSGKWYYEFSNTANTSSASTLSGLVTVAERASVYGVYYNSSNGYKGLGTLNTGATETSYGATWTDNDIIGVALDMDAATPTVTFYKNNSSQGSISVSSFASKSVMVWMQNGANSGNMSGWFNFGQRPFNYTPPTGYVALNTFNLPTPTIGATASTQANDYFDATIWSGDASSPRSITNAAQFQPDFVWIKNRSSDPVHTLWDSVRTVGSNKELSSATTTAEGSLGIYGTTAQYGYVSALNSNGFSVTTGSTSASYVNNSGSNYVAWQWKANGAGSSNTAGTITSTVSANTTAGFSIATYTGNGTGGATFGHGLGVAPSMVIVKNRTDAGSQWIVFHTTLGGTKFVYLDGTDEAQTASGAWNNTAPSSTLVTLGTSSYVNGSTKNYVAYCFAEVAGYSKFGSYTGNGSTDGVFVYLGFRPRWFLVKQTDAVNSWFLFDSARDTYNASQNWLAPNLSNAESATLIGDFVSNGMKIRSSNAAWNGSGNTYIYAAFAESPFKYSLAR